MINRIIQIRNEEQLSQEKFAEKIGLSRNFINQVEAGKKNISDRTISDICRVFNVNEDWLRSGAGTMKKKLTRNQEIGAFANEVMELEDGKFKKRFIEALTKLDENDWEALEKIVNKIEKEGN